MKYTLTIKTTVLATALAIGMSTPCGAMQSPMGDLDKKLIHAAYWGDAAKVKELLAVPGINVNATDDEGRTLLHFAAHCHNVAVVEALLAAPGIDVNVKDNHEWTSLIRAVDHGQIGVIKELLAAPGINVNVAGSFGWTPLHKAIMCDRTDVVKELLAAPGINVNVADIFGETPLDLAASSRKTTIAQLLIAHGAKLPKGSRYYGWYLEQRIQVCDESNAELRTQILGMYGINGLQRFLRGRELGIKNRRNK